MTESALPQGSRGPATSQVEWLTLDLEAYEEVVEGNGAYFAPLGDFRDLRRHTYHMVAADLFWRAHSLAAGSCAMCRAQLRAPLIVVQRALFECVMSAMYLAQHADPQGEATIYRACAIMRELELSPLGAAAEAERQAILGAMPAETVAEAVRREKRGRGWTGKSWKSLGDAVGFSDYTVYRYLSEHAHSRLGGAHVRIEVSEPGRGQVYFGEVVHELELEHAANFARRLLLHAFDSLRTAFGWERAAMPTSDPYAWLRRMEADETGA